MPVKQEETAVKRWHTLDGSDVVRELATDAVNGLSGPEASRRLSEHGPNELEEHGIKSPWRILLEQLTASMVIILIIAAIVSALLGDMKDAVAILVIVVLNALLGFRQEYKAEKAMAALKALAVPEVRAVRNGEIVEISARDLVAGDIVLLEAGNVVPADGRLLQATNLRVQEAALTGESEPVEKDASALPGEDLPLADRRNMAYMGTAVTYGRGRAVITGTGMDTELGRIASMIQTVTGEATPLQRRLNKMGRSLAVAALALVAVIFILGLLRGGDVREMFLIAISMAVAAVPEGLPAVVTIALALGSQRMLKRKALIRKLPAVEALGSVTVICSDKTGTLTQNRMTVTVVDVTDHRLDLNMHMDRSGRTAAEQEKDAAFIEKQPPAVAMLLVGGALCNDAVLTSDEQDRGNDFHGVGDPTEVALVMAAARMGILKSRLDASFPRVSEVPFDSERKRMTTVHGLRSLDQELPIVSNVLGNVIPGRTEAPMIAFTKGAVDVLLNVSKGVLVNSHVKPLTREWSDRIFKANDQLAKNGMRVLGVAYTPMDSLPSQMADVDIERDLIFIGMFGMIDPARPEAKDAVKTCKSAGIRPVMITGDHPLTAQYIAQDLGISDDSRILTGKDLESLSLEELEGLVEDVAVYARVSPEHKLNIVEALQRRNHIVAMTGDGVNDAPALKKADIGVAMGITGTDVTKEVADMVLLDDNFATIVAAVEEGRVIYDNIRKFLKYLLTTNSGEIWLMLLAPFIGMPIPLLPLQILWINLVTDGLPALALGVEPGERDVMRRPPYEPGESIFSRGIGIHIVWVGFLMGIIPLVTGYVYWRSGNPEWQTIAFTVITFAQLAHALAIRSMRYSLFTIGILSNKALLGAVALTFALQLAVIYVPFLQNFFRTQALPLQDLVYCIALSSIIFWVVELEKLRLRRKSAANSKD